MTLRQIPPTLRDAVWADFLLTHKPDVIIAKNSTFAPEIGGQVEAMGIACDFRVL